MADTFDPYHIWLGIPPGQRPPTHYQLLAISPEEQDRAVINSAVTRQSAYVRNFQVGRYGADVGHDVARMSGSDLRRWTVARFEYNASGHDFSLFVGNKRVAREASTIVPWTDRPMPLDLCHAQGALRFLGRTRAVRLENIP